MSLEEHLEVYKRLGKTILCFSIVEDQDMNLLDTSMCYTLLEQYGTASYMTKRDQVQYKPTARELSAYVIISWASEAR